MGDNELKLSTALWAAIPDQNQEEAHPPAPLKQGLGGDSKGDPAQAPQ